MQVDLGFVKIRNFVLWLEFDDVKVDYWLLEVLWMWIEVWKLGRFENWECYSYAGNSGPMSPVCLDEHT